MTNKITSQNLKIKKTQKNFVYNFVKKYYSQNQFELLYNQLQQNFNCQETSSTARILDAVSLLLEFCQNKRNYKHEPIDLLEKNSSVPYKINPKIFYDKKEKKYILLTTPLFEYLIKNLPLTFFPPGKKVRGLHRDKKRLAATAQFYIAQGLYRIIFKSQFSIFKKEKKDLPIFFGGGIANNKIISNYLESKGVYVNKKIPRGDAGISFGQIMYYLYAK
ncbi:hypothetical protein KKA09_01270 [Patescibacteria group bacterium]|nr:hypothetical protein [Patescibacteria group bacterium]